MRRILTASPSTQSNHQLSMGVFIYDTSLGSGAAPWDAGTMDNFISMVNAKPTLIHWFAPLSYPFGNQNWEGVRTRGMMPALSWAPEANNASLISGTYDYAIRQFARDAKAWGYPFILRPAWEMNISNIGPWAITAPGQGNTAASFVTMWRHIYETFMSENVPNVRWHWCPGHVGVGPTPDMATYYPGDSYVDFAGFDAYNWGDIFGAGGWETLTQVFQSTYDKILTFTQKPQIVGETGAPEAGGDKAAWLRNGFLTEILAFPKIVSVWYFHQDEQRINTSAASLDAFRDVMASPLWHNAPPPS